MKYLFVIIFLIINVTCKYLPDSFIKKISSSSSAVSKENCSKKPDRGPCRAMMKGYFYDPSSQSCKEFVFGGCQGSLPFSKLEDCEKTCL